MHAKVKQDSASDVVYGVRVYFGAFLSSSLTGGRCRQLGSDASVSDGKLLSTKPGTINTSSDGG